ncbi:hypothetical protein M406DRAFT_332637 [Cryphonectria parasitica EP155]|uniref:Uncharacterized protein n=1 Tax=Cryphonectria parasitica (strain ATCC 38755 / EP155) TaxID=660469 RepID=A0A9P4XWF5_CRYP1|nr:uncharacterized protein M406DRAFT_332637 [Cryphonectria parasitica EP155]KAF3762253.1 hypothetical protein M406DRAFT_332637 [Cryphonectria parasitica EP155]
MPPIREDADSIFTDLSRATAGSLRQQQRPRSIAGTNSFYQYGEDYITAYDRVGLVAPPGPMRPNSRTSMHSVRSARSARSSLCCSGPSTVPVCCSGLEEGDEEGEDGGLGEGSRSGAGSAAGNTARESAGYGGGGSGSSSSGAPTDNEKGSVGWGDVEKGLDDRRRRNNKSWWKRWRRVILVVLVILIVTGFAVGLAFGLQS